MDVIARIVLARLPDVMEQQRQKNQSGRSTSLRDHRESMPGWHFFDIANRDERVLVHRVLVKEVANHTAADFLEVREDLPSRPTSCIERSVS